MHFPGHSSQPVAASSAPAPWHDAAPCKDCINIMESSELAYWVQALDVSEEKLRMAVAAVGAQVDDVRNHFGAVRVVVRDRPASS